MAFYEKHRAQRARFEILAFHDATAGSLKELDRKLERVVKHVWGGKTLPFPVLLDKTGATVREWGIRAFPTTVLIDPQGRVVDRAGRRPLAILERALTEERQGTKP